MWIETIDIRSFQAISDQVIGPLKPGLVAFLGKNGAGKSTVMEFIRWVLYGDAASTANRLGRGEENTRKHGSITLCDGQKSYCIEREQKPQGKQKITTVIRLNKQICEQASIDRLLANIDRESFRKVFAIGLEELRQASDIKNVQDKLASALQGTGTLSLPEAICGFEEDAKKFVHSHGRTITETSQSDAKLKDAERKIRDLQAEQLRYEEYRAERKLLIYDIENNKKQIELVDKELAAAKLRHEVWENWCRLQQLNAELDNYRDVSDLSELEKIKYDQAKTQRDGLNDQIQEKLLDKDKQQKARERFEEGINNALLENSKAIEVVVKRIKQEDDRLRSIENLKHERERISQQLTDGLSKLGVDWTKEKLERFSVDFKLKSMLDTAYKAIADSQQALSNTQQRYDRLQQDIANKQAEIASRRKSLTAYDELPSEQALKEKQLLVSKLNEEIGKRDQAKLQLSVQPQAVADTSMPILIIVLVVAGLALLLVGIWQILSHQTIAGLVIIALAVAIMLAILLAKPKKAADTANTALAEQLRQFDGAVQQLCTQLGIAEGARLELKQNLEDQLNKLKEVGDLQHQLFSLSEDIERINSEMEQVGLPQVQVGAEQAKQQLDAFLANIGLPDGISIESARSLLELVTSLQSLISELQRCDSQINDAQTIYDELKASIEPYLQYIDTDHQAAIWNQADDLSDRLNRSRLADDQRNRCLEQIAFIDNQLAGIRKKADEAQAVMDDVLRYYNAQHETQMIGICERIAAAKLVANQIKEIEQYLMTKVGDGDAREKLDNDLAAVQDPIDLQQRVQSLQTRVEELKQTVYNQNTEIGSLEEKLRNMETDTALAEQLEIREQAKQQIEQAVRRWLRPYLASKILSDINQRYVNEHQDPVLERASALISQITGGRISRLTAVPLDNNIDFRAIENGKELPSTHWNQALREQTFLALRLGFILNHFEQSYPVPLVLDDVLANCDPEHQQRIASLITKLANETGYQMLVFSCHPETVTLFPQAQHGTVADKKLKMVQAGA